LNQFMNKSKKSCFAWILPILAISSVFFSVNASALGTGISTKFTKQCKPLGITQKEWDDYQKLNKRPFPATQPLLFKRLERAQEYYGDERYDEALSLLKSLEKNNSSNPAAMAQIHQLMDYTYQGMKNYKESLKYAKMTYDAKIFPYRVEQQILFRLATLELLLEHSAESVKYMKLWFEHAVNPESSKYEYLGQALAFDGQLKESVCPIYFALDKWFDEHVANVAKYNTNMEEYKVKMAAIASGDIKLTEKEKPPTEPTKPEDHPKSVWYSVLFSQHWQLKDMEGAVSVVKEALHHYPEDKRFWLNLSSTYTEMGKDEDSTVILALADKLKLLVKSNEIRTLSQDYAYLEVPYLAADRLQKGIEEGTVESEMRYWNATAVNWQFAYEIDKSVYAYFKAAELDDTGKLYADAGSLLTSYERWAAAENALTKAINKGLEKEKDVATAYYNLGIARFNQNKFDAAEDAMEKAGKVESFKNRATQWKAIIESTKSRLKK